MLVGDNPHVMIPLFVDLSGQACLVVRGGQGS